MTSPLRALLTTVLGLVACVLLPLTLVATWADGLVNDGHHYASTVAPLSNDPALQKAAEKQITSAVMGNLDPRLQSLIGADARPTITRLAQQAVESPTFDKVWLAANETAHRRLLKALRGTSNKDVVIPLSTVVDTVVKDLVPAGVGISVKVPTDAVAVTLLPGSEVPRARLAYQRLTEASTWLPWATVVAFLLTLLVARRRVRALAWLGVGTALGGLAVPVALDLARRTAVASAAGTAPESVRFAVWDALVAGLRHAGFTATVVGVVVAVAAGLASLVVRRRG
ncbi:MAG: hypothetical protein ACXVW0_10835 [Nocardioides sp.]